MSRLRELLSETEPFGLPSRSGNCYEQAARGLIELGDPWVLVHATVTGQGDIEGRAYGHAWLENDEIGMVVDLSQPVDGLRLLPKSLYRLIGEAREVVTYTLNEAMVALVRHEHWGPWEDERMNVWEQTSLLIDDAIGSVRAERADAERLSHDAPLGQRGAWKKRAAILREVEANLVAAAEAHETEFAYADAENGSETLPDGTGIFF